MFVQRALFVGINEYHPAIGPLQGCVNDASQVKAALLKRFLSPRTQIEELYDSSATRDAVLDRLDWLLEGTDAGDVLVMYYSGHGTQLPNPQDPAGKDEALVAFSPVWDTLLAGRRDADVLFLPENWELQFIRDKEIKARFQALPDGVNLTLVMDCCYSGDVNRDARTFPKYLEPPPNIENAITQAQQVYWQHEQESMPEADLEELKLDREHLKHWVQKVFWRNRFDFVDTQENNILLAACSRAETAIERSFDGQRGGVFTHNLVDVLHNHDETMTYDDLIHVLGERMRFSPQMPQLVCPERYREQAVFSPPR